MKIRRDRLRKHTYRHIEQELYFYRDTKIQIKDIRDEAFFAQGNSNPEGGKSNLPGKPTESIAIRLEDNKELREMEKMVQAIEEVYDTYDKRHQEFIRTFYWARPQRLTIDGIAEKLYVSRSEVFRFRHRIVFRLAKELGWW